MIGFRRLNGTTTARAVTPASSFYRTRSLSTVAQFRNAAVIVASPPLPGVFLHGDALESRKSTRPQSYHTKMCGSGCRLPACSMILLSYRARGRRPAGCGERQGCAAVGRRSAGQLRQLLPVGRCQQRGRSHCGGKRLEFWGWIEASAGTEAQPGRNEQSARLVVQDCGLQRARHQKNDGGSWFNFGSPGQTNVGQNPDGEGRVPVYSRPTAQWRERETLCPLPEENLEGIKQGGGWWHDPESITRAARHHTARPAKPHPPR